MKIAVMAFTRQGRELLKRVVSFEDAVFDIYDGERDTLREWVEKRFQECDALIVIGAAGIAVRLISRFIVSKDRDPAVIVMDEEGCFIIPILSGHIGGANALAQKFARMLGGTAVITTATDIQNRFAVDVWACEHGCVVDNISVIKNISSAVLDEKPVGFCCDFPVMTPLPQELVRAESGELGICVSLDRSKNPFVDTLNVIPRILTLGAGCRRGTPFSRFESFVLSTLDSYHYSVKALRSLASIDLKRDEPCMLEFSAKYALPFVTFSEGHLNTLEGCFTPSAFVKGVTGVDNVCERSAAARGERLLLKKTCGDGVTLALGALDWRCAF